MMNDQIQSRIGNRYRICYHSKLTRVHENFRARSPARWLESFDICEWRWAMQATKLKLTPLQTMMLCCLSLQKP